MAIPFHVPTITGSERARVDAVLHSGPAVASDGAQTRHCTAALCERLGVSHVLFTPSCTAALEIAALLTSGPGDEIIVPSFTFVTSVSSFVAAGAKPVFCDVRADTLNLDESLISSLITDRTRAIVAVHYGGVACEMDPILELARKHGLVVVEDAAQALTARYKGRPLGSVGDLACFSFHSTKNYHCGEGGALVVNDEALLPNAEIHREKGTNRRAFMQGLADKYTWVDRGSSYVPSELTMAFLAGQLEHVESIHSRRRDIFRRYMQGLSALEDAGYLRLPRIPEHCEPSYHLFYILLAEPADRPRLIDWLARHEIGSTFHYVPLHTSPRGSLFHDGRPLPVTEDIHGRLLRLPLYPGLGDAEVLAVCQAVYEFFGEKP